MAAHRFRFFTFLGRHLSKRYFVAQPPDVVPSDIVQSRRRDPILSTRHDEAPHRAGRMPLPQRVDVLHHLFDRAALVFTLELDHDQGAGARLPAFFAEQVDSAAIGQPKLPTRAPPFGPGGLQVPEGAAAEARLHEILKV